jgi:hypothetical protein
MNYLLRTDLKKLIWTDFSWGNFHSHPKKVKLQPHCLLVSPFEANDCVVGVFREFDLSSPTTVEMANIHCEDWTLSLPLPSS